MFVRHMKLLISGLVLLSLTTTGCVYNRYLTNTERSATEQLLISESMHDAVARLEIPAVAGIRTAIEIVSVSTEDEAYLRSLIEQKLRRAGAVIVSGKTAQAVYVVQAGAIGTISREATFGIPSVPLGPGLATPSLPFFRILKQHGYTRLRLAGYDQATGKSLFAGEPVTAQRNFDVYGLFFMVIRQNEIYPGNEIQVTID